MSSANNAAWVPGKGQKITVGPADIGKPGNGQVLIKNSAVAINPVDWKMQDLGFLVKTWPTILGGDLAGEVVEIGEGVTNVRKGQRVLAHAVALLTGKVEHGAFQDYTIVFAVGTCPIPDDMKYEEAAVMPLSVSTAAAGLFQDDFLNLPYPSTSPQKSGKTLLVWGGSGSVGSQAVQLATAAGIDVITTASQRNFEYCKKLGAKDVFDYHSPNIVSDLTAALQNTHVVGAYDAIGTPESTMQTAQVLAQLGGGSIASVLEPPADIPATVNAKQVFAALIPTAKPHIAKAVYEDFLPAALNNGQYLRAPPPKIVGHGLEQVQAGLAEMKKGVSASKLVVTL